METDVAVCNMPEEKRYDPEFRRVIVTIPPSEENSAEFSVLTDFEPAVIIVDPDVRVFQNNRDKARYVL